MAFESTLWQLIKPIWRRSTLPRACCLILNRPAVARSVSQHYGHCHALHTLLNNHLWLAERKLVSAPPFAYCLITRNYMLMCFNLRERGGLCRLVSNAYPARGLLPPVHEADSPPPASSSIAALLHLLLLHRLLRF